PNGERGAGPVAWSSATRARQSSAPHAPARQRRPSRSARYAADRDGGDSRIQPRHHLVPVGGIAQNGCGDPPAARAGEQAGHRIITNGVPPPVYERAYLLDDRHRPGPLALGALVDQAARAGCGLATDIPDPGLAVDVSTAHA